MATLPRRESIETALSFQFTGDIADEGQLNFYEASRFLYGASRFVYTLEHFRKTGDVLQRINRRVEADFNIRAPAPGSWVLDVLASAAPLIGDAGVASAVLEVPLKLLSAWVVEKLTGGNTNQVETILKIERERTKQEHERTRQSREETRRAELVAMAPNKLINVLEGELKRRDDVTNRMLDEIREARDEAKVYQRLAEQIKPYESQLSNLKKPDVDKLLKRTRSQITEIGLPLKGSASRLVIGGKSEDEKVVFITKRTVDHLEGNSQDDDTTEVVVDIVRFDKESGWGKFRVEGENAQVSFFVPREQRLSLNEEVIESMKYKQVIMIVRYVRDTQDAIKYARVEAINLTEA